MGRFYGLNKKTTLTDKAQIYKFPSFRGKPGIVPAGSRNHIYENQKKVETILTTFYFPPFSLLEKREKKRLKTANLLPKFNGLK